MHAGARSSSLVVLGLVVAACGAVSPTPDAGSAPDAGVALPATPAAPVLTPCPPGWREVPDASGVTTCDPWPPGGSLAATCAPEEAHFPGAPGCARLGTSCAADGWPADLPTGRPVVYVNDDAAAGGDGSTATRALRTLSAALATAPANAVVAIATGRYDETSLLLGPGQTLVGACVSGTQLTSTVAGAEPLVILGSDGAGVRNLAIDMPERIAVGVTAARTTVEDVVVRAARFALFVMSGSVTVHRVAVRDGRTELDGSEGRAFDVGGGARVTLDTVVIEHNPQFGVWVGGPGSIVDAHDVAIRDIAPTGAVPGSGRALYADNGASFRLARIVIERAASAAVFLSDAPGTMDATDLVVRDVQPGAAGGLGRGISVANGATATLSRVLVDHARDSAIFLTDPGSDLTLTDAVVVDTQSETSTMRYGRGLVVAGGAHLAATRLLVRHARESALLAGLPGTRVELTDAHLTDTQSSEADGDWGGAVWAQDGSALRLERVAVDHAHLAGVVAITGATSSLADVTVDHVTAPDCAATTCPDHSGAFGLVSHFGASLTALRFAVADTGVCGVVVGPDGAGGTASGMDLSTGTIRATAVGACVQADAFDSARLRSGVAYVDVGVPLQATHYTLPDPQALPAP